MTGDNQVRARREARGLTQQALAEAVGLTRQSVGAIEAGRATPAVDVAIRVARALGCPVEALFTAAEPPLRPVDVEGVGQGRAAMVHIAGRWVAHSLGGEEQRVAADALVGAGRAERVRGEAEARDNFVLMGCAGALGLLADRLNSQRGAGRFVWLARSSTAALAALAARRVQLAGVHLTDGASGESNVPDVRRHAGADPLVLITLARWEAGLVVAAGNPRKIRGASELGRRGLRIVAREAGSGARRLLERELVRAGLPGVVDGRGLCAASHQEVAGAVSLGAADVGVATRDVAIARGLDFVPLAEERYDLALPLVALADPRLQRLLDVMSAASTRRELAALGYDLRGSGERVAEVRAA